MKGIKYSCELKKIAAAVGVSPMRLVSMVSSLLSANKCPYTSGPLLSLRQCRELLNVREK